MDKYMRDMKQQKEDKVQQEREKEFIEYRDLLKARLSKLYGEYYQQEIRCNRCIRYLKKCNRKGYLMQENASEWQYFLKWHEYYLEERDKFDFAGIENLSSWQAVKKKEEELPYASESDIFKRFDLYQMGNFTGICWNIRISNKATSKLRFMQDSQLESTLKYIFDLQLGYLNEATLLETGPILFLSGFSKMIKNDMMIIFAVVPERVPIIQYFKGKEILTGFQYRQYLRIIDISSRQDQKFGALQGFVGNVQNDPDRWNPFLPSQVLNSELKNILNKNKELLSLYNIVEVKHVESGVKYYPLFCNKVASLSAQDIKTFQFTKGRWVSEMEQSKLSFSVEANVKRSNKEIIEKCTDAESCKWLLTLLRKLPSFQLQLTAEEELLIVTPGNVLCIGRSGTGKTTSAVLRLFALELLFKVRSSFFFKKYSGMSLQDSRKFTTDDVDQNTGLHSIIVTASPVLTNEIRRFYQGFSKRITQALKEADQKRKRKKEGKGEEAKEEKQEEEKEEVKEQEKESESKQEEEVNLDDELLDDEEVEKSISVPHSMNDMKNDDFPTFLTIKRLVYMVDASLQRPFFVRNARNQIIGQDSSAEWHNEQKGVLMINNYFKAKGGQQAKSNDLDDIDKFMELESSDDDEEGLLEEVQQEDLLEEEVKQQMKRSRKVVKKRKRDQNSHTQEFAQEIDFEVFEKKFWNKVGYKEKSLAPAKVWTEIFSVIKGSHDSSDFELKALPMDRYLQVSAQQKKTKSITNTDALMKEKRKIYEYFEEYEAWKRQIRGFDFMDLVNHILREVKSYGYLGTPIHFMLVDEVQDLTPATISLLMKVTEHNIYFAGDTAQTIAMGVGFRFCDLQKMVNMSDFERPKVLQLTVNFRSHNQILQLANSVIGIVELLFPSTIDKLLKEKSEITGLKPIILDSNLIESLFYLLMGEQSSGNKESQKAEFGCDQVIIVRDQESKKKVPSELQHALCLTVYEAKGLEFEDVILFNFFQDSKVGKNQWQILHDIQVKKVRMVKKEDAGPVLREIEQLEAESALEDLKDEEEEEVEEKQMRGLEYEYADKFYVQKQRPNLLQEYSALCTELKQLYVSITRPKKRLIIYDQDEDGTAQQNREQLVKFWRKIDAVDIVTEQQIGQAIENIDSLSEEERVLFKKIAEPHVGSEGLSEEQRKARLVGWRMQGIRMFKRRYYEQAIKCFQNANEEELVTRSVGYLHAEKATNLMSEVESIQTRLSDFAYTKHEKKLMQKQVGALKEEAHGNFKYAAEVFLSVGLKKQAAQCLFTNEQYEQAAKLFEEVGFYAQAGESCYLIGNYAKAAQLYSEGGAVTQAVECYKKMQNWDAILNCIKSNAGEFSQDQREMLIGVYVPLALNSLYSIIFQGDLDEEQEEMDMGQELLFKRGESKREEEAIKMAEMSMNEVDEEEEEDGEEEGKVKESEEMKQELNQIEEEEKEQSLISLQDSDVQTQKSIMISSQPASNPFKEEPPVPPSAQSQLSDFEVISQNQLSSADNNDANMMSEQFEHLSQYDPEDEFIKSRPISIIDSIVSGTYKQPRSELSSYSIVESEVTGPNEAMNLVKENVNLIKTKRDIYAEDLLMTKIVYYISRFSKDVQSHLSKLRSKDALYSQNTKEVKQEESKKEGEEEVVQINTNSNKLPDDEDDDFIAHLDMDAFSDEFINIILDCLESFELYKLCLIICNRFHLRDRIGRYLVSIAYKYSNMPLLHYNFQSLFKAAPKEVQHQVSFLAHHAVHAALELIEPQYLKIKDGHLDEENSLGRYCYTALLELGFWKKLIYLMNVESGLALASTFGDYVNFRRLYLAYWRKDKELGENETRKLINEPGFLYISNKIDFKNLSNTDYLAIKTSLDECIWIFNDNPTVPFTIPIPKVLKFTSQALKIQRNKADEQHSRLESIQMLFEDIYFFFQSLKNLDSYQTQLQIYDASSALIMLLYPSIKDQSSQVNVLKDIDFQCYDKALALMTSLFSMFHSKQLTLSQKKMFRPVMFGMLSVLKIKEFIPCSAIYDNFGDKVLIHYSSPLAKEITEQVEERKRNLTEQASIEVLNSNDTTFVSKAKLANMIKQRLRQLTKDEYEKHQVEIFDLDSDFVRAPLSLVMNIFSNRILKVVKSSAQTALNSKYSALQLDKYSQIDELDNPFEFEDFLRETCHQVGAMMYYQWMSYQMKESVRPAILKYFSEKHKNVKGDKILQKDERPKKGKQLTKHEQYMLESGLVTIEYLEKQKEKARMKKEKIDFLNSKIKQIMKKLKSLAIFQFGPLQKLTNSIRAYIMEIGQRFWILYLEALKQKRLEEEDKHFDYALVSLNCFLICDQYILFMEMAQQSMKESPAKKSILTLIDAHLYRKAGYLFKSSSSLIDFVEKQNPQSLTMSKFYLLNYLEVALVQTLLQLHKTKSLYIPFEFLRHLHPYFHDISQNEKVKLHQDLQTMHLSHHQADVPLVLHLKNASFCYEGNLNDHLQVLFRIAKYAENLISSTEQVVLLSHSFFILMTVLVNGLGLMKENLQKKLERVIFDALDSLKRSVVVSESHSIFSYKHLSNYVKEFHELQHYDQHEVLSLSEAKHQSLFIQVHIKNQASLNNLSKQCEERMKLLETQEAKQIELHEKASSTIKKLQLKQRFASSKQKSIQSNYLSIILQERVLPHSQSLSKERTLEILEIVKLSKFIASVMLDQGLENVIDFHYLLKKRDFVIGGVLENFKSQEGKGEREQAIRQVWEEVEVWSHSNYKHFNNKAIEKHKKIMKLKWKQHALKSKQELIHKAAGRKKADKLQQKKERLKKLGL